MILRLENKGSLAQILMRYFEKICEIEKTDSRIWNPNSIQVLVLAFLLSKDII